VTGSDESTLAYAELQPDDILTTMEELGYHCDGRFLALNSYENRVYQIGLENQQPVVTKFYRPGRWSDEAILEEHSFSIELADADIPVVAPLTLNEKTLHHSGNFRLSVSPCKGGRAPELDDQNMQRQLGRFVARMHLLGETKSFLHRPALDIETYGYQSVDFLLEESFVPESLEDAYKGLVEHLFNNIDACFERAGDVSNFRLHGDFHPGNVLVAGDRLHIVDLDDTRTGPSIQDLWMFLSGDRNEQTPQLATLLEGYQEFRTFDARELNLIEALRTLRIMHYSAWLARRWDEHILSLREQAALMEEPPLEWTM